MKSYLEVPIEYKRYENNILKLGTAIKTEEMIKLCEQPLTQPLEKMTVTLKGKPATKIPQSCRLDYVHTLSFDINEDQLLELVNNLQNFVEDPVNFCQFLTPFDNELGKIMANHKMKFGEEVIPAYLLQGDHYFMPGPPNAKYAPWHKDSLIYHELLLKKEREEKVNLDEHAKFSGFVDNEIANKFVASGHLFSEVKGQGRLLLHGSVTHRLFFEALRQAISDGKFNLPRTKDGKQITFAQLLELFVYLEVKTNDGNYSKLWTLIIDRAPEKGEDNPKDYDFNCGMPFALNNLILCFGKNIGLPNTQSYLLDSHYKEVYQMIMKLKTILPNFILEKKNVNEILYTYCMETLSKVRAIPGEAGVIYPFTEKGIDPIKYPSHKLAKNILLNQRKKQIGVFRYNSWEEYGKKVEEDLQAIRFFTEKKPLDQTKLEAKKQEFLSSDSLLDDTEKENIRKFYDFLDKENLNFDEQSSTDLLRLVVSNVSELEICQKNLKNFKSQALLTVDSCLSILSYPEHADLIKACFSQWKNQLPMMKNNIMLSLLEKFSWAELPSNEYEFKQVMRSVSYMSNIELEKLNFGLSQLKQYSFSFIAKNLYANKMIDFPSCARYISEVVIQFNKDESLSKLTHEYDLSQLISSALTPNEVEMLSKATPESVPFNYLFQKIKTEVFDRIQNLDELASILENIDLPENKLSIFTRWLMEKNVSSTTEEIDRMLVKLSIPHDENIVKKICSSLIPSLQQHPSSMWSDTQSPKDIEQKREEKEIKKIQ